MKLTNIGWTHSTINGSSGCDGCELWNDLTHTCYAGQVHQNRLALSLPHLYARDFGEVRMIPGRFEQAAKWGPPTPAENADKPWFVGQPRHICVGDRGYGDYIIFNVGPDGVIEGWRKPEIDESDWLALPNAASQPPPPLT